MTSSALIETPDSPLVARLAPSANHGARRDGLAPSILLLHYTGMGSAEGAIRWLADPKSEVSCHYVVLEDGTIVQMVAEARRAWHAGAGSWQGESDINSRSIGIEIVNGGHDFGLPDYPESQLRSVIALSRDIVRRRGIAAARVLAHSDIAPGRKNDPGEKFPWERLAAEGVGVMPTPGRGFRTVVTVASGTAAIRALQRDLARIGYPIAATGAYDAETRAVVIAFQRHFRRALVTGEADAGTRAMIAALLRHP